MAALTIREPGLTGLSLGAMTAAAVGGDTFVNNGLVILIINNPTGAGITITADAPGVPTLDGAIAFNPDTQKVIAAGALRDVWGPFEPWRFNDAQGRVALTYTAVGLMLEPVRLRK